MVACPVFPHQCYDHQTFFFFFFKLGKEVDGDEVVEETDGGFLKVVDAVRFEDDPAFLPVAEFAATRLEEEARDDVLGKRERTKRGQIV